MIDVLLLWVGLFGVWPFADPGHDAGTLMSAFDIAIHILAWFFLFRRWELVRRARS